MTILREAFAPSIEFRRLGNIAQRVQETGHARAEPLSVYLGQGVVRRADRDDNHNVLGEDMAKYQLVLPGDLVFNRLRTWQGGFGASRHRGIVSPAYIIARPSGADARYLNYVLQSRPYLAELTRLSKWMPPSQFDILWGDLKSIEIPWRPRGEQRQIADFLDDRVGRIDRIIADRRKQAILLRAARLAAIGEVMDQASATFGLAPVRRYTSGIEQGASPRGEDRPAEDGERGVLKTSAVQSGAFRIDQNKVIANEDADERYRIRPGDVLITRGSGSAELVGDAAVAVPGHGTSLYLSDLTYRLRGLTLLPEYACLAIICPRGRAELGSMVRQGSGPAKARGDDILAIPVPRAPMEQQTEIVQQWRRIEDTTEAGAARVSASIDLLTEYKQSLITAAVTGELDVTAAGSGIPV